MNVVFFGTPDFVVPILEALHKTFSVIGVVTSPDQLVGRKKILTPSPVKLFAQENNIEAIFTPQQFDDEAKKQLNDISSDLFIVAAYGKIIPKSILDIPKYGALNIHPSLLPKYRGPSPIQTALFNGDSLSGISIIKMDEKMDHGPILSQEEIVLTHQDTFAKLHHSLFLKAAEMLIPSINKYVAGELKPVEQDEQLATYCHMITKENGYFDSDNPPPPDVLDRMIRAYYPWPTAWTKWQMANGKELIVKFLPEQKIQLEGGKPMSVKDLFNGHPEMKEMIERLILNA